MSSPYPYRIQLAIVDANGKQIGRHKTACFNTLQQAIEAIEDAGLVAYEHEPDDIEDN